MDQPLLEIENLKTHFATAKGTARAVDGVDLTIGRGETVGVVGESGCGKTMLALSVLRLIPDPPGRIVDGRVLFKGRDLVRLSEKEMRAVRGNHISMIFQEPMTSLNPVFTVGDQVAETLRLHRKLNEREALEATAELFGMVGIPNPAERLSSYPHEFSGGMRQRVIIAMSLACDPELILADEPTTALDVTIQAQILKLMLDLQEQKGASIMLITHDLGVVAQSCARAVVMYTGRVVESATVEDLFREPLHPYTQGLMQSVPRVGAPGEARTPLTPVSGVVPSLVDLPRGCTFHPRCPMAFDRCRAEPPQLKDVGGRTVRCWLHG